MFLISKPKFTNFTLLRPQLMKMLIETRLNSKFGNEADESEQLVGPPPFWNHYRVSHFQSDTLSKYNPDSML